MVEVFGCIAVAETALRLAVNLGRLIKALKAAPNEILALANEINNLKLVLDSVRQALSGDLRTRPIPSIEPLLFQTSIRFEEVDKLVSRLGQLGPYGSRWNIRTWERYVWLRERDRVAALQTNLKDLRSNIALALGASGTYVTLLRCLHPHDTRGLVKRIQ